MRTRTILFASSLSLLFVASAASAATLQVGPGKPYAAPCAAIKAAAAGDTIEIDAAGTYQGDVCYWATDNLTIKGVNGRPKIDAAGQNQGGKAIWVIGGQNTLIDNVELTGATVPDQNGAGIRQEGKNLTVKNTYFHDNEDGILAGDVDGSEIIVDSCEFANNGFGDGYSHNLYINHVAKFVFIYNYTHDCKEGHLVKSRAAENYILYNRITEENGTGSYEINLPNGGKSYVIGNLVQQGPSTHNPAMLSYGEEGMNAKNPSLELFVVNNTFVNDKGNGTFLQIGNAVSTPVVVTNNIFKGAGTLTSQATAVLDGNFTDADGDPMLVNAAAFDYHLQDASPCKDKGVDPGMGAGMPLDPVAQYVHPEGHEGRMTVGTIDIGAYEIGGATGGGGTGGGSGGTSTGGSTGGNGTGGTTNTGGSGGTNSGGNGGNGGSGAGNSGGDSGGCGCRTAGTSSESNMAVLALVAGLAIASRRRKNTR